MALGATIYKAELHVANLDQAHYSSHALTLARHPSETDERLMLRLLAFALYAADAPELTKDLAATDQPALWALDMTGDVVLWIELGLPDEKRLRQAAGRARRVVVLSYGGQKQVVWWQQHQGVLGKQRTLTVLAVPPEQSQALAALATRTMQVNVTVQDGSVWFATQSGSVELQPRVLQGGTG